MLLFMRTQMPYCGPKSMTTSSLAVAVHVGAHDVPGRGAVQRHPVAVVHPDPDAVGAAEIDHHVVAAVEVHVGRGHQIGRNPVQLLPAQVVQPHPQAVAYAEVDHQVVVTGRGGPGQPAAQPRVVGDIEAAGETVPARVDAARVATVHLAD
ncbi:MAG: hypothetical protein IPJ21_17450 [Sterolibacteriaceae bacterium]|nr:hypothetical protein [Sterolibacteriaceae bacterium]